MTSSERTEFDFAIVGDGTLPGLVAACLAADAGKRVCVVAQPWSPFALERRIDLSVDLVTRPETLILLRRLTAETLQRVAGLGKGLVERVDPLLHAETPASIAALGHFRHQAELLGHAIEVVSDRSLAEGAVWRIRAANLLSPSRFPAALEQHLDGLGVVRLDSRQVTVSVRRDGVAELATPTGNYEAGQAVFAEDSAIAQHLSAAQRDRSLRELPMTAILAEPSRPLAAGVQIFFDRGLVLRQEARSHIAALIAGTPQDAEARLAASVTPSLPLRRAGAMRFATFVTADGGPMLAPTRAVKALHLAGFGLAGTFLAPAIARQLAGRAEGEEAAWFAVRGATRGNQRQLVAEYQPVPAEEVA